MFHRSVVFAVWLFGVRLFDVQLFVVCVPNGVSGKCLDPGMHCSVIHHSVTVIKIIHKMNCLEIHFSEMSYLKVSNKITSSDCTGGTITNTDNSAHIRKNSKSYSVRSIGSRKVVKKRGPESIHCNNVPSICGISW
jgi:hypothetical protein